MAGTKINHIYKVGQKSSYPIVKLIQPMMYSKFDLKKLDLVQGLVTQFRFAVIYWSIESVCAHHCDNTCSFDPKFCWTCFQAFEV